MSITVEVNEALLQKAADFVGVQDQNKLVEAALQALIEKRAYRLGVDLGGTDPDATLEASGQTAA